MTLNELLYYLTLRKHYSYKKIQKLLRGYYIPYLPMLSFDINAELLKIKQTFFPNITCPVNIFLVEIPVLACIRIEEDEATIFIHIVLNDPRTPKQVIKHIIIHELIHMIVKPAEVDGKVRSHTPAFREMERRLSPDASSVWSWIYRAFYECVISDKNTECTIITQKWKKIINWSLPHWETVYATRENQVKPSDIEKCRELI